jgi:hypothetical protein
MAQFYTDFSDSPTLTERWNTADYAATIQTSGIPSGGGTHALRILRTGSTARFAVSWDNPGTSISGDVEVLAMMQHEHTSTLSNLMGPALHGAGAASSESAYFTRLVTNSSGQDIVKYVSGGSTTQIASGTMSISRNVWYRVRLQRTGTTIRTRIWQDGSGEPGTWDASTTDTSLSSGWTGIWSAFSAGTVWYAWIGVGTGGDPAPDTTPPQYITPAAINNTITTNSQTVTRGKVNITPAAINNSATVNAHTVTRGPVSITPAAINATPTVNSQTVTRGALYITPAAIDNTITVNAHDVFNDDVFLSPDAIGNTIVVNGHTVTVGPVYITPAPINATPTVNAHSLVQYISPAAIDATPTLNGQTVVPGAVYITPNAINATPTLNTHTLTMGAVYLTPPSIDSTIIVNGHALTYAQYIQAAAIDNSITINEHQLFYRTPWRVTLRGSQPGAFQLEGSLLPDNALHGAVSGSIPLGASAQATLPLRASEGRVVRLRASRP